jgi:hypothetical protein
MRLRIVACEIFYRELCHLAARSPRKVDVEFLPKGLHDQGGAAMRERLQAAIDATDPGRHDAVALAYGLCNNGLVGLEARGLPLVLMRAHACITAFLGSRDRYAQDSEFFEGKLVPEGIEARVPYKGPVSALIPQLIGGLRSGMGYVGARNLSELQAKAQFIRTTSSGLRESHVHDVIITKEPPNYRTEL